MHKKFYSSHCFFFFVVCLFVCFFFFCFFFLFFQIQIFLLFPIVKLNANYAEIVREGNFEAAFRQVHFF